MQIIAQASLAPEIPDTICWLSLRRRLAAKVFKSTLLLALVLPVAAPRVQSDSNREPVGLIVILSRSLSLAALVWPGGHELASCSSLLDGQATNKRATEEPTRCKTVR